MIKLAIIGGSGLASLSGLQIVDQEHVNTPYGDLSEALSIGLLTDKEIIFLSRHGSSHHIPPHMINYRANIWALKQHNVTTVIGINAVGGISRDMSPNRIVIPDQIIDYTWSRDHTFYDDQKNKVTHIEFAQPYNEELRQILISTANESNIDVYPGGVYGATQGPRLETAAEISRMENDGCDIVGMTGMPEASLARELDLSYASISIVANWAAGKSKEAITMEIIEHNMKNGINTLEAYCFTVIAY